MSWEKYIYFGKWKKNFEIINDDIGILLYLLHTLWPKPGHLLQANKVTGQRIVFRYLGGGGGGKAQWVLKGPPKIQPNTGE